MDNMFRPGDAWMVEEIFKFMARRKSTHEDREEQPTQARSAQAITTISALLTRFWGRKSVSETMAIAEPDECIAPSAPKVMQS
jgi:hypothetical protein